MCGCRCNMVHILLAALLLQCTETLETGTTTPERHRLVWALALAGLPAARLLNC